MGEKRRVGVAIDFSATSRAAVRWAVENLVEDGDTIIAIHVQSSKAETAQKKLWGNTGSPLIPLEELREMNLPKLYGVNPDPEILDLLDSASRTMKVVCKIYWGDPREKLCDAVEDLKLDCLVVGSRGLGVLKRLLLGSVSKYVVTNATCPVTVVKGAATPKT
ncbi:universal stress protein PHOS34 isoform X2 [Phalaenopsis equestris]|uniref:universal stress protein PHOS34 isoform X2 n=1 Tax=Phalaenopsis equestris TaxID=78828 RepID=UPI0009E5CB1A|nr:universal stress protein PHOS34 isoform X2 [Phalaenopsis equestris]